MQCDTCVNYVYDEFEGCDVCMVNLDEDEIYRLMEHPHESCPYYQVDDEYQIVRHQM